jgi:hypothetical protein
MIYYCLHNNYAKFYFETIQEASQKFLDIAKIKIHKYKHNYGDDIGYLDLNLWITIDDEKHNTLEYWMLSNIKYTYENINKILLENVADQFFGLRIKSKQTI